MAVVPFSKSNIKSVKAVLCKPLYFKTILVRVLKIIIGPRYLKLHF